MKKRSKVPFIALGIPVGYLLIYLLGRVIWCRSPGISPMDWLFFARPTGENSYLYGWLLSSHFFYYAAGVSVLPLFFGKTRFSSLTFAGFSLGLLFGILFGPYPEGIPYGQSHRGWLIWLIFFLISAIFGVLWEIYAKKRQTA